MALKRNFQPLETFSMSSMTDVIFLLLIFFMVTSTIIFPGAIDVNLPQSGEQSSEKPSTQIYVTADKEIFLLDPEEGALPEETEPLRLTLPHLNESFKGIAARDSLRPMAIYADSVVDYGLVVRILDMAAKNHLRAVLSTRLNTPAPASAKAPATNPDSE